MKNKDSLGTKRLTLSTSQLEVIMTVLLAIAFIIFTEAVLLKVKSEKLVTCLIPLSMSRDCDHLLSKFFSGIFTF